MLKHEEMQKENGNVQQLEGNVQNVDQQVNVSLQEQNQQIFENHQPLQLEENQQANVEQVQQPQQVQGKSKEMLNLFMRKAIVNTSVIHCPEKSVLVKDYSSKFKSRLSDRKRLEKQNNRKSRLHQKKLNKEAILGVQTRVHDDIFVKLEEAVNENTVLCDKEELCDLAAFMNDATIQNHALVDLFLGSNENQDDMNKEEALDIMLKDILDTNLEDIRLNNDTELARNAEKLERLSIKVAAFDRLSAKYKYFENFGNKDHQLAVKEQINDKLEQMRSVVYYYQVRKELITDDMYSTHYNDELSMDVTAARNLEEEEMASKLLRAYVAGKNMMEKNGKDRRVISNLRQPHFRNRANGQNIIKGFEAPLKHRETKSLLQERYRANRPLQKAERFVQKNVRVGETLQQKALENFQNYEGREDMQPGYKEEEYDATKIKGYVDELNKIKISDLKCKSYSEMIENFKHNYALCVKVEQLQHKIVRGFMHGWNDNSLSDELLIDLRAKGQLFYSFKNTLCAVNGALLTEKNSQSFSNEQWLEYLKLRVEISNQNYISFIFQPGDPSATYVKYKNAFTKENEEKDKHIKHAYKYFIADNMDQEIPPQELEKRRGEYCKKAFMDDYMNMDVLHELEPGSLYAVYLQKKNGKKVQEMERTFGMRTKGKSAKEVERIYKLATGNASERFQYYKEIVDDVFSYDIKKFNTTDMGSFFDDWDRKKFIAVMCSDNMLRTGNHIKDMLKNPKEGMVLPKQFSSIDEMTKLCNAYYDFGSGIMSGRIYGICQMASTKLVHALSYDDFKNITSEKMKSINENIDSIQSERGEDLEENNYIDDAVKVHGRMLYLAVPDDTRPLTMLEEQSGVPENIIRFDKDVEVVFKETVRDVEFKKMLQDIKEPSAELQNANNAKVELYTTPAEIYEQRFKDEVFKYGSEEKPLEFDQDTQKKLKSSKRVATGITNAFMYLYTQQNPLIGEGLTEPMAKSMFKAMAYLPDLVDYNSKEGKEIVENYQILIKMMHEVDIKDFNFMDAKDLASEECMQRRMLTYMASELVNVMKNYTKMRKDYLKGLDPEEAKKQTLFKFDENDVKKAIEKANTLITAGGWYGMIPQIYADPICKTPGIDVDELLKCSHTELVRLEEDQNLLRKFGQEKWIAFIRKLKVVRINMGPNSINIEPGSDISDYFSKTYNHQAEGTKNVNKLCKGINIF